MNGCTSMSVSMTTLSMPMGVDIDAGPVLHFYLYENRPSRGAAHILKLLVYLLT